MTRRTKAGGKGTKLPDRKSGQQKPRGRPQKEPRLASPRGRKTLDIEQLVRERDEALEQQEASLQVLQLISSSPGDLQPVFVAILRNATRICAAKFGVLWLYEGKGFRCVALHDVPKAFEADFQRQPVIYPPPGSPLDALVATQQVAHISDLAATAAYTQRAPSIVPAVELGGVRTLIHVPMVKLGSGLVGAITVFRQEVRPFADKEIALLQNFAAQAVIAIENARLLTELRQRTDDLSQRTDDLTEALEQQTATSEVLGVISRSPMNTQPVFDAIEESAARLCDAVFSMVWLYDGKLQHFAAGYNTTSAALAQVAKLYPKPPDRSVTAGRAMLDGKIVHVPDTREDQQYSQELAAAGNWRAALAVPMLRDGKPIGAISIGKAETGPFLDRQIQLLITFADQAVIAIENTRLLNELRELLQQQTATAEVLKTISRSTLDLPAVLMTLVETASRHCDAYDSLIFLDEGGKLRVKAHYGPLHLDFTEWPISREWITGRAFIDRTTIHVHDPATLTKEFPDGSDMALRLGYKTILAVPLLRENAAIGALTIRRSEAKPFSKKQIELVETFADQAVIAIENVRLFEAVRQCTHELSNR